MADLERQAAIEKGQWIETQESRIRRGFVQTYIRATCSIHEIARTHRIANDPQGEEWRRGEPSVSDSAVQ